MDMIELRESFYDYMDRIGLDNNVDFLDYLENQTGYFDMPASSKYHCNYKHGLLEHSINVTDNLIKLDTMFDSGYSLERLIIMGLFHDLGKAGHNNQYPYILMATDEGEVWRTNKDIPVIEHATLSVYMLAKWVDLSMEEIQAIRYHNGQYVDDPLVAMKEEELTLLLHWADMLAAKREKII